MDCPKCKSSQSKKNGFRRSKQSYKCKKCGAQYVANPSSRAYSQQIKQTCIEMYLNGMGIRGISRVTKISHVTIVNYPPINRGLPTSQGFEFRKTASFLKKVFIGCT